MPAVDLFDFVPLCVAGDRAGRKRLTALYPHDRRATLHYATSPVGIRDTRAGSVVFACVFRPLGRNFSPLSRPSPRGSGPCAWLLPPGVRRELQRPGDEPGGEPIASWAGWAGASPASRGAGISG